MPTRKGTPAIPASQRVQFPATVHTLDAGTTLVMVAVVVDVENVVTAVAAVEAHIARMGRDDAILHASIATVVTSDAVI